MVDKTLQRETIRYLNQVFGADVMRVADISASAELPFFLQDLYDIAQFHLIGHSITLACAKSERAIPAQQMTRHVERLREQLHSPVLMSMAMVAPGERRQLIRHGVSFVVPGHQMYAPQIGLILTERASLSLKRQMPADSLASPATQALLIWFLLHHPVGEIWHPFDEAASLGYAAMTATRAIREMVDFGLFELDIRGRVKYLRLVGTRRDLWQKAKPHLRSPVLRTLWTYDERILTIQGTRTAGEGALASMTMLNEPGQRCIAMVADEVQVAKQQGIVFEPYRLEDAIEVQIWRYKPFMRDKSQQDKSRRDSSQTVDPLSLWLSMRDIADDRIQIALGEVEENFVW